MASVHGDWRAAIVCGVFEAHYKMPADKNAGPLRLRTGRAFDSASRNEAARGFAQDDNIIIYQLLMESLRTDAEP